MAVNGDEILTDSRFSGWLGRCLVSEDARRHLGRVLIDCVEVDAADAHRVLGLERRQAQQLRRLRWFSQPAHVARRVFKLRNLEAEKRTKWVSIIIMRRRNKKRATRTNFPIIIISEWKAKVQVSEWSSAWAASAIKKWLEQEIKAEYSAAVAAEWEFTTEKMDQKTQRTREEISRPSLGSFFSSLWIARASQAQIMWSTCDLMRKEKW
jgi:hypothetical protein